MPLLGNISTLKVRRLWTLSISSLFAVAALVVTLLFLHPTSAESASSKAEEAAFFPAEPPIIRSHLYEIQLDVVELEAFPDSGGAIEPLGNDLLLVTPRGRIALIDKKGKVEYLPQRVPMNESASEAPVLWKGFRVADILLHQRQPNIFTLFVSHHYFTGDCVEFRVSSTSLHTDDTGATVLQDWKTEFIAHPCIDKDIFGVYGRGGIQAGGRMLMDGPEHILLVTGDHALYDWYLEGYTQEPGPATAADSHLGKLLRIELASGEVEIVAGGFRNPQGFTRDADGNLWQTEHGPQGGDELNLLRPGLNYGWPYVTHGTQYGNRVWPSSKAQGRHDGFEKPVFSWIPSIGISNLIVSDSRQFPLWQNDILIGSLISHSLFRARLHQGHVIYVEKIEIGARIRDITQMADGRIAFLTDTANILFLQRAPVYCQADNDVESIYSYDAEIVCIDLANIIAAADDPEIRLLKDAHFDSPPIRSTFTILVHDNRITYVKSPCAEKDLVNRFFLHITPADANDLVEENEHLGFNVLDFNSDEDHVGVTMHEDGCLVTRTLPEYELKHIFTGQVVRVENPSGEITWKGPVWEGSYTFGERPASAAERSTSPYPQVNADDPSPGAELFAARCAVCHNLAAAHHVGPHLNGVIGRRAGDVAGFTATAALTALDIVWTQENLAEFIANPSQFAPGTTMADMGITAEEARIIADFLATER